MYNGELEFTLLIGAANPEELTTKVLILKNYVSKLEGYLTVHQIETTFGLSYKVCFIVNYAGPSLERFLPIRDHVRDYLAREYYVERVRLNVFNKPRSDDGYGVSTTIDVDKTFLEQNPITTMYRKSWNITKDPNIVTLHFTMPIMAVNTLATIVEQVRSNFRLPPQEQVYRYCIMDNNSLSDEKWIKINA